MNTIELTTTKIEAGIDEDGIGWITFNNPARHNALRQMNSDSEGGPRA